MQCSYHRSQVEGLFCILKEALSFTMALMENACSNASQSEVFVFCILLKWCFAIIYQIQNILTAHILAPHPQCLGYFHTFS